MGDFEKADVALAVIQIPFKRGGHGDDGGGAQDSGFRGKRIGEARGLDIGGAEQGVALFGDVRDGENFAVAQADEAFAQT